MRDRFPPSFVQICLHVLLIFLCKHVLNYCFIPLRQVKKVTCENFIQTKWDLSSIKERFIQTMWDSFPPSFVQICLHVLLIFLCKHVLNYCFIPLRQVKKVTCENFIQTKWDLSSIKERSRLARMKLFTCNCRIYLMIDNGRKRRRQEVAYQQKTKHNQKNRF